jgi:hypothetical protein
MERDQSQELILQLLTEDLDELEGKVKGKQAAGTLTDLDNALECMRDDILAARISIDDEIPALSMSTAVATDQDALASILHDEIIAEQDHRFAIALQNGEELTRPESSDALTTEAGRLTDTNEDAVDAALGVLMGRMAMHDNSPNGEGSSRLPSFLASISARECAACLQSWDEFAYIGSCTHEICRDCTRQIFLMAMKDEELYPPRCCGDAMPPEVGLSVLNHDEYHEFSQRAIEWTTKDRLYCADMTCSKFIPPSSIQDELGSCPSCQQRTHVPCRSLEHPGTDCPKDEVLHDFLEMAVVEKWKRCLSCRNMVELDYGCNHITCR